MRLVVVFILLVWLSASNEQVSAAKLDVVTQKDGCVALLDFDFSGVQDAPVKIISAQSIVSARDAPALCLVQGYVAPKVGFELRLPQSNWNGKLIAVGNGGWGGAVPGKLCESHLKRGYACVASDAGHKGVSSDGSWAVNNLSAQVDFGYRSVHVSLLAAKAIVSRFYSKDAMRSYFVGCSTGGYEGLVEAQRFPWDFDGILAGAPDMDEADLTMRELWESRSFLDSNARPLLDEKDLRLLHEAVLAECDKDDGVADGILGNPMACRFDPLELVCKAGEKVGCLTEQQVGVVRRIYAGPPMPAVDIQTRGALPGSELNWNGLGEIGPSFADGLFRYMIYGASPEWTPANYDFNHDYKRLGLGAIYTDTNPDLRRFKGAGGKLLAYQGWTDVIEMPSAIVDYYETVEKTMGGRASTQDFFRLFMIPGMNHCGGGTGAFSIDYLSYLEAWVEERKPPDVLVGAHISDSYQKTLPPDAEWPTPDLSEGKPRSTEFPIAFTRPVYPYPFYAVYSGAGDPNVAANFLPAKGNPSSSTDIVVHVDPSAGIASGKR